MSDSVSAALVVDGSGSLSETGKWLIAGRLVHALAAESEIPPRGFLWRETLSPFEIGSGDILPVQPEGRASLNVLVEALRAGGSLGGFDPVILISDGGWRMRDLDGLAGVLNEPREREVILILAGSEVEPRALSRKFPNLRILPAEDALSALWDRSVADA